MGLRLHRLGELYHGRRRAAGATRAVVNLVVLVTMKLRSALGFVALSTFTLLGCPSPEAKAPPAPEPHDAPPAPTPEAPAAAKVEVPDNGVVDVAAFAGHRCLVRKNGAIACWGKGSYGQLGQGKREDSSALVAVASVTDAIDVGVGRDFSCAVRRSGKVACWGNDEDGQLGRGKGLAPGQSSQTPVEVVGLSDVTAISVGEFHACALGKNGTVSCWGNGEHGQLGRSVKRGSDTPLAVESLSGVAEIAVGASHSCARLSSGEVRCWGRNTEGQLGAGVTGGRANPVVVSGLTDAKRIASGHLHSCAVRGDDSVVCWGDQKTLELGGPALPEKRSKTPIVVPGLRGVTAIAGGARHTCAVLSSGSTSCWGDGAAGELGKPEAPTGEPREVAAGKGATRLALGDGASCALRADGTGSCWGAGSVELGAATP